MADSLKPGDQLRLIGEHGTPFSVTVSAAWTPRAIEERIRRGEWRYAAGSAPTAESRESPNLPERPEPDGSEQQGGRPAQAAPKAAWIDHVLAAGLIANRDTAEAMTKTDLIEIAS